MGKITPDELLACSDLCKEHGFEDVGELLVGLGKLGFGETSPMEIIEAVRAKKQVDLFLLSQASEMFSMTPEPDIGRLYSVPEHSYFMGLGGPIYNTPTRSAVITMPTISDLREIESAIDLRPDPAPGDDR